MKGSCHCGNVEWSFEGKLESVTACNCTVCRRYGVLWAYGHENVDVSIKGKTQIYQRGEKHLEFHFCGQCGCVASWRGVNLNKEGQRRLAVNVRLVDDPESIAHIPVDHFDGLLKWEDQPSDGRCVRDMWF